MKKLILAAIVALTLISCESEHLMHTKRSDALYRDGKYNRTVVSEHEWVFTGSKAEAREKEGSSTIEVYEPPYTVLRTTITWIVE